MENKINENRPESRPNDGYDEFSATLQETFDSLVDNNTPIFITKTEELFETFLKNLPEEGRQHYTCNTCRSFVNKFGGLVTISESGQLISLLWNDNVPTFFSKAVNAVKREVLKSKIDSVFITDVQKLGIPKTGEWSHLHLIYPKQKVIKNRLKTTSQLMAEYKEEFKMLLNAVLEFNTDVAKNAYHLVNSGSLYRGDKVLGVSKFFYELKESLEGVDTKTRDNLIWLSVAKAPEGFCHIKNNMIGTLLEDINAGMSARLIKARFEEKMNPESYGRSQNAPTSQAIEEAEKIVSELGIANSLQRRYANFDELPSDEFVWKPTVSKVKESKSQNGVFSNITPRNKQVETKTVEVEPSTTMTWAKFSRTVLPSVQEMDVLVNNTNRLMALVTANDKTAPNILQWDNPFSWYYHGGIDGEVKKRVEEAGGRYENNEIRCSLIWESYTDLDLHCVTPNGRHIYYGNKVMDRGYLDVDMNAGGGRTLKPVENIRFSDNAPLGVYKFYVHNYADRNGNNNPFKVELEVNGEVFTYQNIATTTGYQEMIFEFEYQKDKKPNFITKKGQYNVSNSNVWNVLSNNFIKVNGILPSPNLWGDNQVIHVGQHMFFLLDGCKDESEGKGKGFFTEMLKSELRPIRRTLDAFTDNSEIIGVENSDACGMGFSTDSDWNLTLRVKTLTGTQLIKIDRFD